MRPLADNLVVGVASVIDDDVTTTDELIPSGESSSYRSNPYRLSRLALSRRDPGYAHRTDVFPRRAMEITGDAPRRSTPIPSLRAKRQPT